MSGFFHHPRRQSLIEIALIFAVFAVHGGWPVPDNNEPYYLGKAIHFWNPDWLAGDFFLESPDAHVVFYYTFGWLSLWLGPAALAWTGRTICWLLLAWAWRRLSFAALPRPWWAVLTAALFVGLMERFHMAGEWVVAGVEAKPFAYALVFLGLEAILRNRWNRGLLLLGAAAAFHPLVGGWSAVAAGFAWMRLRFFSCGLCGAIDGRGFVTGGATDGRGFVTGGNRFSAPPLRSLWPGIAGGLLLALPGVLPSLMLDWGVDRETARQAHLIYVFERLPHHLAFSGIYTNFILRMALLACFWLLLGIWRRRFFIGADDRPDIVAANSRGLTAPGEKTLDSSAFRGQLAPGCCMRLDVLRAFVAGAVAIALTGAAIHLLIPFDKELAAGLLRFYWFRLLDAALPLGVAIESAALIAGLKSRGRHSYYPWLAFAIVAAGFHLGDRAIDRVAPAPPRSHKLAGDKEPSGRQADFDDWLAACEWIARSGEIPPDAVFITPRLAATLRWYAGRREVVSWKDVPQSASQIVQWRRRLQDIYETELPPPARRWFEPLAAAGADHLQRIAEKYHADYVITERTESPLDLPEVYGNRTYAIYRLK